MPDNFLPGTLSDWIGVLFQSGVILLSVLGLVWKFLKTPIETSISKLDKDFTTKFESLEVKLLDKFKNQGERIGEVEAKTEHQAALTHEHQKQIQAQEFKMLDLANQSGRIESTLTRLDELLNSDMRGQLKVDSEIKERLAGIEAKMEVFQDISNIVRDYLGKGRS